MKDNFSKVEYPELKTNEFLDIWRKSSTGKERFLHKNRISSHRFLTSNKDIEPLQIHLPIERDTNRKFHFALTPRYQKKDEIKIPPLRNLTKTRKNDESSNTDLINSARLIVETGQNSVSYDYFEKTEDQARKNHKSKFASFKPTRNASPTFKTSTNDTEIHNNSSTHQKETEISLKLPPIDKITGNDGDNYLTLPFPRLNIPQSPNSTFYNDSQGNTPKLDISQTDMKNGNFEPHSFIKSYFPKMESQMTKEQRISLIEPANETSPRHISRKENIKSWRAVLESKEEIANSRRSSRASIIVPDVIHTNTPARTPTVRSPREKTRADLHPQKISSFAAYYTQEKEPPKSLFDKYLAGPNMMISRLKTLINMQLSEFFLQREFYDKKLINLFKSVESPSKHDLGSNDRHHADKFTHEKLLTEGSKPDDVFKDYMRKKQKKTYLETLKNKKLEESDKSRVVIKMKKAKGFENAGAAEITTKPAISTSVNLKIQEYLV